MVPGFPALWRVQAQLCPSQPTEAFGGPGAAWTLSSLPATSDPESVSLGQSPINNRFQVANPWFMLGTVIISPSATCQGAPVIRLVLGRGGRSPERLSSHRRHPVAEAGFDPGPALSPPSSMLVSGRQGESMAVGWPSTAPLHPQATETGSRAA